MQILCDLGVKVEQTKSALHNNVPKKTCSFLLFQNLDQNSLNQVAQNHKCLTINKASVQSLALPLLSKPVRVVAFMRQGSFRIHSSQN
jgi:hypothetical protein